MATATARAPQPGNEEGRPVAGRPSEFVNNGIKVNSTNAHRVQFLTRNFALEQHRAQLVAALAWEARHG